MSFHFDFLNGFVKSFVSLTPKYVKARWLLFFNISKISAKRLFDRTVRLFDYLWHFKYSFNNFEYTYDNGISITLSCCEYESIDFSNFFICESILKANLLAKKIYLKVDLLIDQSER